MSTADSGTPDAAGHPDQALPELSVSAPPDPDAAQRYIYRLEAHWRRTLGKAIERDEHLETAEELLTAACSSRRLLGLHQLAAVLSAIQIARQLQ